MSSFQDDEGCMAIVPVRKRAVSRRRIFSGPRKRRPMGTAAAKSGSPTISTPETDAIESGQEGEGEKETLDGDDDGGGGDNDVEIVMVEPPVVTKSGRISRRSVKLEPVEVRIDFLS